MVGAFFAPLAMVGATISAPLAMVGAFFAPLAMVGATISVPAAIGGAALLFAAPYTLPPLIVYWAVRGRLGCEGQAVRGQNTLAYVIIIMGCITRAALYTYGY
jgi:hypothetical protein